MNDKSKVRLKKIRMLLDEAEMTLFPRVGKADDWDPVWGKNSIGEKLYGLIYDANNELDDMVRPPTKRREERDA